MASSMTWWRSCRLCLALPLHVVRACMVFVFNFFQCVASHARERVFGSRNHAVIPPRCWCPRRLTTCHDLPKDPHNLREPTVESRSHHRRRSQLPTLLGDLRSSIVEEVGKLDISKTLETKLAQVLDEIKSELSAEEVARRGMQRLIEAQNGSLAAVLRRCEAQTDWIGGSLHALDQMMYSLEASCKKISGTLAGLSQQESFLDGVSGALDSLGGKVRHCCLKLDGIANLARCSNRELETSNPSSSKAELKKPPVDGCSDGGHTKSSRKPAWTVPAIPIRPSGKGVQQSPMYEPPAAGADARQELEECRRTIGELRRRAAAHEATEARRTELQTRGRLLKTLSIPGGATEANFSLKEFFVTFSGSSTEVNISEPYLVSNWQVSNLSDLLHSLISYSHVRMVRLVTHDRARGNSEIFNQLQAKFHDLGMILSYSFQSDLHVREISYNNGITISADRGLDLYKPRTPDGTRHCRPAQVLYFETDALETVKHHNIAARVASDARDLLADDVIRDIARIDALVKSHAEQQCSNKQLKKEEVSTMKYRQMLEGKRILAWVKDLGLSFTEACRRDAVSDGYECPAQYFVANAELLGKDPFDETFFQT